MKNYFKKIISFVIVCTLCAGGMPQSIHAATIIYPNSVTVSYTQQSGSFVVYANEAWNATPTACWIRITKSDSTVKYEVTQNDSTETRTGTIVIFGKGYLGEFVINQKPKENVTIIPWEEGPSIEIEIKL